MKASYYHFILIILVGILVYSRFTGLNFGLPYSMHPDERNMAISIMNLTCDFSVLTDCFNPHFYAYGQLPLYLGYLVSLGISFVYPASSASELVTLALRSISAFFGIFTVIVLMLSMRLFGIKDRLSLIAAYFLAVFTPAFIQFSHFGTTESMLMFFFATLIYLSLKFILEKSKLSSFAIKSGLVLGLALGTKVSSLLFILVPACAFLFYIYSGGKKKWPAHLGLSLYGVLIFLLVAFLSFVISSPYNFFASNEFLGSIRYESDVALGTYRAFYTRQFEYSLPVLFQGTHIFPYTLGVPIYILFIIGFLLLPWKKEYVFMRLQFLLFLLPVSIIYAKWSRFVSPIFPLMMLMSALTLVATTNFLSEKLGKLPAKIFLIVLAVVAIIPGLAYLTIYQKPDVRFEASKWIFENTPADSYFLAETANVIDVPIPSPDLPAEIYNNKNYEYVSFNYYELDNALELQEILRDHITSADYIFVPSRRIFWNHTCYTPGMTDSNLSVKTDFIGYEQDRCDKLKIRYPILNSYYDGLFGGQHFVLVKEFSSYPRIEFFGKNIISFPDENAEETWTVFDHPVIRIYKKK